jgi:hypothetical protein
MSASSPARASGYTLEGLDAVGTSIPCPTRWTARSGRAGRRFLLLSTRTYRLGFFNGSAKEARITTQEVGDTAGMVTRVSRSCR